MGLKWVVKLILASFPGLVCLSLAVQNLRRKPGNEAKHILCDLQLIVLLELMIGARH